MGRKETPVLPQDAAGQLYETPHVVGLLLNWLLDDTQPDLHVFEQTLDHLIGCSDCRTTFRVLLAVLETGSDQFDEQSIATFKKLDDALRELPVSQK